MKNILKSRWNVKRLVKNKRFIGGAGLLIVAGTVLAIAVPNSSGAEEQSPIVAQVDNHEKRIGDLEDKTDKTQTQVDQNSADISEVQKSTGTSPAAPVAPVNTPVTKSAPASTTSSSPAASAPAAQPTPNPRTITNVADTPDVTSSGMHDCKYTLNDYAQSYKLPVYVQANSNPCYSTGDVLPY